MTKPCRIHVVDDDPAVLKMMSHLLDQPGFEVRTYTGANDFLGKYVPMPCECLITDLRMPVVDGLTFQGLVRERKLTLPVIFFSGFADVTSAVKAMRGGAFDFIEKPFDFQHLMDIVRRAIATSKRAWLSRQEHDSVARLLALLTAREREIAEFVGRGQSNREIAQQIGISVRTVEHHRAHALEKLRIKTTVELAQLLKKDAQ